jgi:hypothetical protein
VAPSPPDLAILPLREGEDEVAPALAVRSHVPQRHRLRSCSS